MPVDQDIIEKAVEKAKENRNKGDFTHTVDISINLRDIDLKQPQNRINTELELPHGPGEKEANICVCTTSGDFALRARQHDLEVLDQEALSELQKNKSAARKMAKQFDFFVASVEAMPLVARSLGPILGPQGKMPLGPPKGQGIVPPTAEIQPIIDHYKNTVRIKMRKSLQINCPVGSEDMENEKIIDNITTIFNFLERNLEKGIGNFKKVFVKTTMGHPVKMEI